MNAKDEKKKRRETFLLEQFFKQSGVTPTTLFASEEPDFLIELNGRTIGVEITNIYVQGDNWKPNPALTSELKLQAAENYTDGILSKAREIYFATKGPPVSTQIVISNAFTYAMNRDRVAELIAHRIFDMASQDPFVAEWRPGTFANEDDLLCESIHFMHIWRSKERFARWTTPNVGLVATLTPEHLIKAIKQKKCKINDYRLKAREIWLLMVADRILPSQRFQRLPNFSAGSITSPFDRTFFFNYMSDEPILELFSGPPVSTATSKS